MKPGAYQTDCRVVVQRRAEDDPTLYADGLTVGLLLGAPSAEGLHKELSAEGYDRQPLTIGAFNKFGRAARSAIEVRFPGVLEWPEIHFVGVFAADGTLLAWGRLRTFAGHAGPDEIVFAASAIQLRFS
jgi:hypothetical protein